MTRKEAVKIIKNGRIVAELISANDEATSKYNLENIEALNMAVQALEQEPCEDCVSRGAIISMLSKVLREGYHPYLDWEQVYDVINTSPSVYSKQKTGHWKNNGNGNGYIKWHCSECNMLVRNSSRPWYKHCPNCGARMEV